MSWRAWTVIGLTAAGIGLLGFGAWKLAQRAPAQILTLPNGIQYRFAGVTYGTNHVMTSGLAAVVGKLPRPLETLARRWLVGRIRPGGSRSSTKPSLVVWFTPLGTNAAAGMPSVSVRAALADENGWIAGEQGYLSFWFGSTSPQYVMQEFDTWPRRSRTLECVVFDYDYSRARTNRYQELGRFRFRNPSYQQYPDWTPDELPITKAAGDIDITLHSFASDVESGGSFQRKNGQNLKRYSMVEEGREPNAAVRFTVDSPRGTNESWTVSQFFLTDATGNHQKASSWSSSVGRPAHFSPVLWPDEKAWKLTTRFKRTTGIPKGDLLVFRNIPLPALGQTNEVRRTNTVHDIECVLDSIVIQPPMTNSSYSSRDLSNIELKYADLPKDFAVDLISVAFDDPKVEAKSNGSSWGDSHYTSEFRVFPTNQTHATITYAIQKTREVEFMVPPNWLDSTNTVEMVDQ